jgi:hypothetical protein
VSKWVVGCDQGNICGRADEWRREALAICIASFYDLDCIQYDTPILGKGISVFVLAFRIILLTLLYHIHMYQHFHQEIW